MGQLIREPVKIIYAVASSLFDNKNFNFLKPYDNFEETEDLVKENSKWVGADVDYLDVEFICEFIRLNLKTLEQIKPSELKKNNIGQLVIPQERYFNVYYETWGNCLLTEYYVVRWPSFGKELAIKSLKEQYYSGNFSVYDGNFIEHEAENFENDHFGVTDSELIDENKKTILDKLVVENTSEILDSLDEKTLLELRNLINQKLSSF